VRNQADHKSIGRIGAGGRASALLLPVAIALLAMLAFGTMTSFAAPAQPLAATVIPCGTTAGNPCPTLIPVWTKVPTFTTVPATATTVPATATTGPGTSTAVPATNTPTSGGGGAVATDTPTSGAAAAAPTETPTVVAVAGAAQAAPAAVAAASLPASGGFALLPLLALGAGFAAAGLAFRRARR
jgi:hypothetical protein